MEEIPAPVDRYIVHPIIYRVLYIPGGWEWNFWTINSSIQPSNLHLDTCTLGGAESSRQSDEVYVQEELTRELRTTLPPAIKASWSGANHERTANITNSPRGKKNHWVLKKNTYWRRRKQKKKAKRMISYSYLLLFFFGIGFTDLILINPWNHYPSDTQPAVGFNRKTLLWCLERWLSMSLTQSLRAKKRQEIANLKGLIVDFEYIMCGVYIYICVFLYYIHQYTL